MLANFLSLGLIAMGSGSQPGQPQQGNLLTMFGPLVIIFVIFYFLLIRPQKTQQKKLQQMVNAMRKGDAVITRAGIHGKIAGVNDTSVTVEIAENVRVKMTKDAIVHVTAAAE